MNNYKKYKKYKNKYNLIKINTGGTLNETLNIAVYAGTFNPPTKGHIAIVKGLIQKGYHVLMVPITSPPPYKPNASSITDRIKMCELAIQNLSSEVLKSVSISEISKENDSEYGMSAYRLMHKLTEKYPNNELYCVQGTDNLRSIEFWDAPDMRQSNDEWYKSINSSYISEGHALINQFKFIIIQRLPIEVYPMKIPDSANQSNFIIENLEATDISSSKTNKTIDEIKYYINKKQLDTPESMLLKKLFNDLDKYIYDNVLQYYNCIYRSSLEPGFSE